MLGKRGSRVRKEEQFMTYRNLNLNQIIDLIEYIWRRRGRLRVPQKRKRRRIVEEELYMPVLARLLIEINSGFLHKKRVLKYSFYNKI